MQRINEPDELQIEFGRRLPSLILASSSPNRKALLEKGGCSVRTFTPDADEEKRGDTPEKIVEGIAERKIRAYMESEAYDDQSTAIAADTLVLLDGELLGKPKDREDAERMLRGLSGRSQTVISAVGMKVPGKDAVVFSDEASVIFLPLSAGAYRLQKTGYKLVERIDGDWTTVVGLPLKKILDYLYEL